MSENPDVAVLQNQRRQDRRYFIDTLHFALVMFVVAHHAGQPNGPTDGDWPVTDPANLDWLGSFLP